MFSSHLVLTNSCGRTVSAERGMASLLRRPRIMLRLSLAAFVLLAASPANAQTAGDGVRALIRGDYDTAVRILRPLADRADPDPTAAFFMGIAYHSGLGVP